MDIIHILTIVQTLLVALAVNIVAVLYMVMFVGCDTLSIFYEHFGIVTYHGDSVSAASCCVIVPLAFAYQYYNTVLRTVKRRL